MAESVGRYRRLLGIFRAEVTTGSAGDEVFNLPIVVRRDGAEFKVGQVVRRGRTRLLYLVREILQRGDLTGIDIVLSPVELRGDTASLMEEIVLASLQELIPLKQRLVSLEVARDGMRKVSGNIGRYPEHIQRTLRKYQVASLIRDSVQKFLAGFSLARSVSLGCFDWRFDPGILGLERDTDYSLEYKVEQYVELSSQLDLILGRQWDVRRVCGGEGFRVILTLELWVDTRQQMKLETHATTCPGDLSPAYRLECVAQSLQQSTNTHFTSNVDRLESLHSVRGISLDWEEFQDSRQLEETMEITNIETDIASALRDIEDSSFSDNMEERNTINENLDSEEIEETSAALKRLLETPTKGFSQLVFNVTNKASGSGENTQAVVAGESDEILSQVVQKTRDVRLSEEQEDSDADIPNLSPIKLFDNHNIVTVDVHSREFRSDFIGSRQTTSTPEGDDPVHHRYEVSETIASDSTNPPEQHHVDNEDDHNDEDDVFSEDYRVSSSNNLNHTNIDINCNGKSTETFKIPEYSSSKVRAYVESLPSPAQSKPSNNPPDSMEEKRLLDESFDSEASSRSRVSKLSDISNLAGRFANAGIFYGSALGGQQQGCPFPEEWQFQTIPESIENNDEID